MHSFTKYEIDNIPSLVEPLLPVLLFGLYATLYIHVAATYYIKWQISTTLAIGFDVQNQSLL